MKQSTIYKYSLLVLIASIDIFMFYINFQDELLLYFGAITHLALLFCFSEIWAERKEKRTTYYLYAMSNYLLIACKYLYPKGTDTFDYDTYGSLIYFIPLFVNYFVSHNVKQLVVLDINSMMVVGLCQIGEHLHFWGLNDLEGNGVVTFLTAVILFISVFISIILLQIKNKAHQKSGIMDTVQRVTHNSPLPTKNKVNIVALLL